MKRLMICALLIALLVGCSNEEDPNVYREPCSICHKEVESWISTVYGDKICASCFYQEGYSVCRGCNLAYSTSEFDCADGYCTDCAEENVWGCSLCEALYGLDHLVDLGDGYYICPKCAGNFLSDETEIIKKESPLISRLDRFPGN